MKKIQCYASLLVAVLAVGCGGDDGDDNDTSASDEAVAESTDDGETGKPMPEEAWDLEDSGQASGLFVRDVDFSGLTVGDTVTVLPDRKTVLVTIGNPGHFWKIDAEQGTAERTGDMLEPRTQHAAVAVSEGLLIAGGIGPDSQPLSSCELYRSETGQFESLPTRLTIQGDMSCARVGDRLIFVARDVASESLEMEILSAEDYTRVSGPHALSIGRGTRGTVNLTPVGEEPDSALITVDDVLALITNDGQERALVTNPELGAISIRDPFNGDALLKNPSGSYDRVNADGTVTPIELFGRPVFGSTLVSAIGLGVFEIGGAVGGQQVDEFSLATPAGPERLLTEFLHSDCPVVRYVPHGGGVVRIDECGVAIYRHARGAAPSEVPSEGSLGESNPAPASAAPTPPVAEMPSASEPTPPAAEEISTGSSGGFQLTAPPTLFIPVEVSGE